ncbi:hypothetical protein AEM42_00850 [Betaproteobacteria bacterium UKL13-2]|nr:hypothetical protein AEM42_00850 [Betaproteobacteria bacterium UKL13-2]HCG53156.1 hypothetical protein [Betaproteobacteria bacterium]
MLHTETKLGTPIFVESGDSFVFAHQILERRQAFGDAVRRHPRKIGNTNNPHIVAYLDSSAVSIKWLVAFNTGGRSHIIFHRIQWVNV